MIRVLVVDDEPQLLRALRINLAARQYDVVSAATAQVALAAVKESHPDLVVLDLGLPDLDGVEVIRRLRTWTQVPIIVLSGRTDSHDKVAALDAGADDYVTKPFGLEELLARVRVATRDRTQGTVVASVRIGRHVVDLENHEVRTDEAPSGDDVRLTRTEWDLLEAVVSQPGKLLSQHYLLEKVWGPTYRSETQYVRQYMARLRGKLEDEPTRPKHLLTQPGMGYRFQP